MIELSDRSTKYINEVRKVIDNPGIEPITGESNKSFEGRQRLARQIAEMQLKSYLQGIIDHNGNGKYELKDNKLCPIS